MIPDSFSSPYAFVGFGLAALASTLIVAIGLGLEYGPFQERAKKAGRLLMVGGAVLEALFGLSAFVSANARDAANQSQIAQIQKETAEARLQTAEAQRDAASASARAKEAEARAAEANARTADANQRTAAAQIEVAKAQTEAAKAKAQVQDAEARASEAKLALEPYKDRRILTPEVQKAIQAAVKPYPKVPYAFAVAPGAEPLSLMDQIAITLSNTDWLRRPYPAKPGTELKLLGLPTIRLMPGMSGLRIEIPSAHKDDWGPAAVALLSALGKDPRLNATGRIAPPASGGAPNAIAIMVGTNADETND